MSVSRAHAMRGFTIIEALIFITVLSLFFIATLSVSTAMLRTMKSDEQRLIADRYAQEAYQWLRTQKEIDWAAFYSKGPGTYCLSDTLSLGGAVGGPNSCPYDLASFDRPNVFRRWVSIIPEGGNDAQVRVRVVVEWEDGQTEQDVTIDTVFSLWSDLVN